VPLLLVNFDQPLAKVDKLSVLFELVGAKFPNIGLKTPIFS